MSADETSGRVGGRRGASSPAGSPSPAKKFHRFPCQDKHPQPRRGPLPEDTDDETEQAADTPGGASPGSASASRGTGSSAARRLLVFLTSQSSEQEGEPLPETPSMGFAGTSPIGGAAAAPSCLRSKMCPSTGNGALDEGPMGDEEEEFESTLPLCETSTQHSQSSQDEEQIPTQPGSTKVFELRIPRGQSVSTRTPTFPAEGVSVRITAKEHLLDYLPAPTPRRDTEPGAEHSGGSPEESTPRSKKFHCVCVFEEGGRRPEVGARVRFSILRRDGQEEVAHEFLSGIRDADSPPGPCGRREQGRDGSSDDSTRVFLSAVLNEKQHARVVREGGMVHARVCVGIVRE